MLLLQTRLTLYAILPLVVRAWITCPCTRNSILKSGPRLSTSPCILSMTVNNNDDASSSFEEEDINRNDDIPFNSGDSGDDDIYYKRALRKYRIANAQARIDKILKHPTNPPFDFKGEIKKVTSISPPLIEEGSAEFQLEEQVSKMEEQMWDAVKAENFDAAAKKQIEISQAHVDDCGLVLQANSAFYRAFTNKNLIEMESLWLKDPSCICIHPSFKPISGIPDIISTFKRMFEPPVRKLSRIYIDPCDIKMTVKATNAVVTCTENVYARDPRGEESELVNKLTATNMFRKLGGKWYMTYHHSSWHADSKAAKKALDAHADEKDSKSSSSKGIVSSDPFGGNILDLEGSQRDMDGSSNDNDDEDDDLTELEGIVGHKLSADKSKNKQGETDGQRTNLDFLKDLGMDGMLGLGGGNADGTGLPPGSIIRIAKINNMSSGGNNDDEDDDETNDDERDGSNGGMNSILELLGDKKKKKGNQISGKDRTKSVRSKCIDALRKLSKDGRISKKQQRVLLTDIISCSARGQESLVEHAYNLLCFDSTDEEAAEEDFVDQCQVFAEAFME